MLLAHGACGGDSHPAPGEEPPAPGSVLWASAAGGPQADEGVGLAADATGIYVVGGFNGAATFGGDGATPVTLQPSGGGAEEAFVARYDQEGTLLWARAAGGSGGDRAEAVAVAPGGAYVTGHFAQEAVFGAGEPNETALPHFGSLDTFLARYDDDGTLSWARGAGSFEGHDVGRAVAASSKGAYVAGRFATGAFFGYGEANQTNLTSAGLADVFLAHYGSDGALDWVVPAGGEDDDEAYGIAAAADGGAYVVGAFRGTAFFGDEPEELTSAGGSDAFLARYDEEGGLVWAERIGGTEDDVAAWVGVSQEGHVFVTGSYGGTAEFGDGDMVTSAGGSDVFVARYDDAGMLAWVASAGGTSNDEGGGGAVARDGGVVATGGFGSRAVFGSGEAEVRLQSTGGDADVFVAYFDEEGALVWATAAGGGGIDRGYAAARMADGSLAVAGRFAQQATFGADEEGEVTLGSAGSSDAFVARIAP